MLSLEKILGPVSVNHFLKNYKGKKSLFIPGPEDRYPELFGWEEINDFLNFGRPSLEAVRLVYEKNSLDRSELSRLFHWLTRGATLVINHVQHIDPVVEQLADKLGNDMNSNVNINCYASFPTKQGFNCHYDGHDVFIMHTCGEKMWKVFEPTVKYPLDIDRRPKPEPPEELTPYLECKMTPGDVLYIPRGHWHYALSTSPSVHLTVSQKPRSGIEFLLWMSEQLLDSDEFLRQDFPVVDVQAMGGKRSNDEFQRHLKKFREHLHEIIDDQGLEESFVRFSMINNSVRQQYQLPEVGISADNIQSNTRLHLSESQKALVRYDDKNGTAVVTLRGKVLNLNNVSIPMLEGIFSMPGDVFSGDSLMHSYPELHWESLKFLLEKLFEEGMLIPVAD